MAEIQAPETMVSRRGRFSGVDAALWPSPSREAEPPRHLRKRVSREDLSGAFARPES